MKKNNLNMNRSLLFFETLPDSYSSNSISDGYKVVSSSSSGDTYGIPQASPVSTYGSPDDGKREDTKRTQNVLIKNAFGDLFGIKKCFKHHTCVEILSRKWIRLELSN